MCIRDRYLAICNIRSLLLDTIRQSRDEKITEQLKKIDNELQYFLEKDIDFKEVVDGLDDSIFITDAQGDVYKRQIFFYKVSLQNRIINTCSRNINPPCNIRI